VEFVSPGKGITTDTVLLTLVPTLGIVIAEMLMSARLVTPALWFYVATVVGCTLLPLRLPDQVSIFAGFGFLATFRLVNLSMPVFLDLTVLWLPLVYAPFLVAATWFLQRNETVTPGLSGRGTLLWSPFAVVAGLGLASLQSRLVGATALLPTVTSQALWLLAGIVVLGAITEELLFRGVLQSALRPTFGSWAALGVTSVVFAAMQAPFGEISVAIGFVAGVIYGLGYELSDSLAVPVVCHVTLNLLLFVVAATPLSTVLGPLFA